MNFLEMTECLRQAKSFLKSSQTLLKHDYDKSTPGNLEVSDETKIAIGGAFSALYPLLDYLDVLNNEVKREVSWQLWAGQQRSTKTIQWICYILMIVFLLLMISMMAKAVFS